MNRPLEARFGKPHVRKKHLLVRGLEVGNLRLERRANRHDRRAFALGIILDGAQQRIFDEAVLGDVGDVHRRLHRQQKKRLQHRALFRIQIDRACGLSLIQGGRHLLERCHQALCLLVAARARDLGVLGELLIDRGEVRERELRVDRFDVRHRIDRAGDVYDVVVGEAAHDVGDGIGLADVGQELVAQSFALGRARDEPRDVDKFHSRGNDTRRARDARQRVEPWIGHGDNPDVGLDRAERVVLRGDAGFGQRVE